MPIEDGEPSGVEEPSGAERYLDQWNNFHERVAEYTLIVIVWRAIKRFLKIEDVRVHVDVAADVAVDVPVDELKPD